MSQLFGIGSGKKKGIHHEPTALEHSEHEGAEPASHAEEVDVEIHDNPHEHDVDVGQIAVDILDLAEAIVIIAPLAGVDPAEIDISLSRNILTLSGERRHSPIYLDAKRTLVEECYYGPFSRSIILPENLAFNKIKAKIDLATIMIHVPKISFFSKQIKIEEIS